jgi:hypothetical protein
MITVLWLITVAIGCLIMVVGIVAIERIALARWLFDKLFHRVALMREPDFVVGQPLDPYLHRWWILPRNRFFNVYLHCFLRSDDDRALHDHPWHSFSLLLSGECVEHTIDAGGIHQRRWLCVGDIRYRDAAFAHRIELPLRQDIGAAKLQPWRMDTDPCWTLFITGPVLRDWGFHCAERGWIPWQTFLDPDDKGLVGKGCDA